MRSPSPQLSHTGDTHFVGHKTNKKYLVTILETQCSSPHSFQSLLSASMSHSVSLPCCSLSLSAVLSPSLLLSPPFTHFHSAFLILYLSWPSGISLLYVFLLVSLSLYLSVFLSTNLSEYSIGMYTCIYF